MRRKIKEKKEKAERFRRKQDARGDGALCTKALKERKRNLRV